MENLIVKKYFLPSEQTVRPFILETYSSSISSIPKEDLQLIPTFFKTGAAKNASGSCYLEHGGVKIMCSVYGPKQSTSDRTTLSAASDASCYVTAKGFIACDFKFSPFSNKSIRYSYAKDFMEQEYAGMIAQTLEGIILADRIPNSYIEVQITVLESGASVLADAVNAAVVAICSAGIEIVDLVSCCQVGIVSSESAISVPLNTNEIFSDHEQHSQKKCLKSGQSSEMISDMHVVLDPIENQSNSVGILTVAYSCNQGTILRVFYDGKGIDEAIFENAVQLGIEGCCAVKDCMKSALL